MLRQKFKIYIDELSRKKEMNREYGSKSHTDGAILLVEQAGMSAVRADAVFVEYLDSFDHLVAKYQR